MNSNTVIKLSISLDNTYWNKNMKQWNVKLHNLISILSSPSRKVSEIQMKELKDPKDYKYFRVGPLSDPSISDRSGNINRASVLILDLDHTYNPATKENIDGCPDIDSITSAADDIGAAYHFYTSFRHRGDDYRRGRMLLFLDRQVNKTELVALYRHAVYKFTNRGVLFDSDETADKNESTRIAQIWYMPNVREKYEDQFKYKSNIELNALPVDKWLSEFESQGGHVTPLPTATQPPESLGKELSHVVDYTPKEFPHPLEFIDFLNYAYNTREYMSGMLTGIAEYDMTENLDGSRRFLFPGSTSGNAGGKILQEPSGRLVYLSHHPEDPLTGPPSGTSDTGFLPLDAIELYRNLQLGVDTKKGNKDNDPGRDMTQATANDWYLRKYCDYMSERFVALRGKQLTFVDLFQPNSPAVGKDYLRTWYSKFTLRYLGDGKKAKIVKCLPTWMLRMNKEGGMIREVHRDDGYVPGGSVIIKEAGLNVVNTYVHPVYHSLPKPQFPDRKHTMINHVGHLTNYDDFEHYMYLSYIADIFQNPSNRGRMVQMLITPLQRMGKSLLFEMIGYMIGDDSIGSLTPYELPGQNNSSRSQFDDGVIGKLVVVMNEVDLTTGKNRVFYTFYDDSKSFFMDGRLTLNRKGGAKITSNVYFRVFPFTNKSIPFWMPMEDGRFFVIAHRPTEAMIEDPLERDRVVAKNIPESIAIRLQMASSTWSDNVEAHKSLHAMYYYLKYEHDLTEYNKHMSAPDSAAKEVIQRASMKPMDRYIEDLLKIAPYFITRELFSQYMSFRLREEGVTDVGIDQIRNRMKASYPVSDQKYCVQVVNRSTKNYNKGTDKVYLMSSNLGIMTIRDWSLRQVKEHRGKSSTDFRRHELIRVTREIESIVSKGISIVYDSAKMI